MSKCVFAEDCGDCCKSKCESCGALPHNMTENCTTCARCVMSEVPEDLLV